MPGSNIETNRKVKGCSNFFSQKIPKISAVRSVGRPKYLTEKQSRQIQKLACEQKMSFAQIQEQLQLPCTSRTVNIVLSNNPTVQFKKFKGNPPSF